jgi:hypothetical protein
MGWAVRLFSFARRKPVRRQARDRSRSGRFRPGLELLEDRLAPAAFLHVTSLADTGTGSLRQVLSTAGNGATIVFDVAGPINLASALPTITQSGLTLDGTSASGYAAGSPGTPLVILNGSSAGPGVNGLTITGGSDTIKGLDIVNFQGNGIVLTGQGNGNTIQGNYIGIATDGITAAANTNDGILINGDNQDVIGGTSAAQRNIISGNGHAGLEIDGYGPGASNQDIVEGNYIGTNAAGTAAVANAQGVLLVGASNNFIGNIAPGAGNVISGNTGRGITLTTVAGGALATAAGNVILGNFIGTQPDGVSPLGNGLEGIYITNGASSTAIGSVFSSGANTIAFNTGAGILIGADSLNPVFPPRLDSSGGANNAITGNSISHSGGIVLNGAGNNLQAAPVLGNVTPAAVGGGTTTIEFTLANTIDNVNYRIEFFANDPNNAEGKTYLGAVLVLGDGGTVSGEFTSADTPTDISDPSFITATATSNVDSFGDPGGSSSTSQFSAPAPKFADDFNRASPGLGPTWQVPPVPPALRFQYRRQVLFSEFQLPNDAALSTGTSIATAQVPGLTLLNPIVQADVDASNSQAQVVGLMARIQSNGDAYVAALTPDGIAEILLYDGVSNTLSAPLAFKSVGTKTATLTFTVTGTGTGTTLSLFLNGSSTASVTVTGSAQTTLDSAGGVGILAGGPNGIIDNFAVSGM